MIACPEADKTVLNPEFFQSTDTTYWISTINQLLEGQSVTSNVYPHSQNWGEFPVRNHLWSKALSQRQREAVSLRGEERSHTVVKQWFLPTLSSWGRALAVALKSAAKLFTHCLPSCTPHPFSSEEGKGNKVEHSRTKHRIPQISYAAISTLYCLN